MRKALEDLIRKGIVIKIPHRHGEKVYINPLYKGDIEKELRRRYTFL
jgi:hypothetical protein